MTVGVVVVVAGRHDHLARTLASLRHQSQPADSVVVVDMVDDATTAKLVDAAGFCRFVVGAGVHDGDGWPLAAARNAGANAIGTEHLVFLDVDCLAAPDLVEAYVGALTLHPGSLACGPVRYLDEGWPDVVEWRPDGRPAFDSLVGASVPAARPVPRESEATWDHELFWSLAFGTSRTVWRQLGGFDEGYVGYGAEDTDFGLRARVAGVPMRWLPSGTAFHQWHPASRHDDDNHAAMVRNARRYRDRWGTWPMPDWLRDLDRQGRIRFDELGDSIELIEVES